MTTKKTSQLITPTSRGRVLLVALYQRLQQVGFTPHAVCAQLELMRDSPNIEITPPLPQGRLIPHGDGLALKTANGIRNVSRVYLRALRSAPPAPWRPEWHAISQAVALAGHDTAANSAMPKPQRRRKPQRTRGHGYDWDDCWKYALTLRAVDAWDWTEHRRDKNQPLPAVRKVVEDKLKDWFKLSHQGRVPDIGDIRRNIVQPLYKGSRRWTRRKH